MQSALYERYSSQTYRPLGHILIAQKVITRRQLMSVLVRFCRSAKLGQLLIMTKAVTLDQLTAGLTEQRRTRRRLGQVLLELKQITEAQLRQALCLQLHIKFFDLETIVPDTSLRSLINAHFAEARLVVPMALTAVDGLPHAFEDGVEELTRLLGVAVGEQLHRALEVGEEDGHLLALALQRGFGREDLFGEVLGGVTLGRP